MHWNTFSLSIAVAVAAILARWGLNAALKMHADNCPHPSVPALPPNTHIPAPISVSIFFNLFLCLPV